jgi:ATP/maltotriose-dependent transcriptional regulator MalT
MSKYCNRCKGDYPAPGEHWYRSAYINNKSYYKCKIWAKKAAKHQCKNKKSENFKAWYKANKEYNKERWQKYYKQNKATLIARAKEQARQDRTNLNGRLKRNLRTRMSMVIRGKIKSGSTIKDLGCDFKTFMLYIEGQFTEGMSWENYGEWHLDPVNPLCNYDLTCREDFLEAVSYLNLQPLWAKDNFIKGGRL